MSSVVQIVGEFQDLVGVIRAVLGDVIGTAQAARSVLAAAEVTRGYAQAVVDRAGHTVAQAWASVAASTPELLERVGQEVLPMVATLESVAPDVRELVESVAQLNEMFGHVPGIGRIKKRLDEQAESDEGGQESPSVAD